MAMDAGPEIDRARAEVGSVEGEYLELGTHYANPALKLRERKTGDEIWCWVSDGDLERFSEMVRTADIWRHKRVRARGKILYDRNGKILRVEAQDVQPIDVPLVTLDEVRDPHFTNGLTVSEYLNRLRDGTLG